jgi:hypothetical protein
MTITVVFLYSALGMPCRVQTAYFLSNSQEENWFYIFKNVYPQKFSPTIQNVQRSKRLNNIKIKSFIEQNSCCKNNYDNGISNGISIFSPGHAL